MGGRESGQVGNQAAISGYFHVLGLLFKRHFFVSYIMSADSHGAGSGNYQVVARRYRPKTFDELVGQPHIAQALSNALTSGRVGHAYLFTGVRGVGKTSTARIFAKCLNCVDGPTLTPCGVSDSCQNISIGEDIDALEIDGASNRGIDEIRQLRQNVSICPSRSKFKIYIIDEVHMLTTEAFNALLKILEEPPGHVKFIFCTTNPTKLPVTILSRCQRFDFIGIEMASLVQRLSEIATTEGVAADEGVFELLARRAMGSMRDAQSLLEQLLSFAPEHITPADVHEMLGTADEQLLIRLLEAISQGNSAEIFVELDKAASSGVDFGFLVEQLMGVFRDLLLANSGDDPSLLIASSPSRFEQLKTQATTFGTHRILASLQILDHLCFRMAQSTQARVLTELALIRLAHLDHFQMVSVLLEQLRSGQAPVAGTPSIPAVKPVQRAILPPKSEVTETLKQHSSPSGDTVPGSLTKEFNADKAAEVWFATADGIPGMLGQYALGCKAIAFENPNIFVATFEHARAQEFCEKESARLQSALSQRAGQAIRVRFVLVSKPEDAAKPAPVQGPSKAELNATLKEAANNPLVKKIAEIFGAELHDIL